MCVLLLSAPSVHSLAILSPLSAGSQRQIVASSQPLYNVTFHIVIVPYLLRFTSFRFNGTEYFDGQSALYPSGNFTAAAQTAVDVGGDCGGLLIIRWETSGGVETGITTYYWRPSVTLPTNVTTNVTVTGAGNLTAVYPTNIICGITLPPVSIILTMLILSISVYLTKVRHPKFAALKTPR